MVGECLGASPRQMRFEPSKQQLAISAYEGGGRTLYNAGCGDTTAQDSASTYWTHSTAQTNCRSHQRPRTAVQRLNNARCSASVETNTGCRSKT
jgi:hypothetical protein